MSSNSDTSSSIKKRIINFSNINNNHVSRNDDTISDNNSQMSIDDAIGSSRKG